MLASLAVCFPPSSHPAFVPFLHAPSAFRAQKWAVRLTRTEYVYSGGEKLLFPVGCSPFPRLQNHETTRHHEQCQPTDANEEDVVHRNTKRIDFKNRDEMIYTAKDIAVGAIDVNGWTVEVDGKGVVGNVIEILHLRRIGKGNDGMDLPIEYILKVCPPYNRHSRDSSSLRCHLERSFRMDEDILIPLVDEFMQSIDAKKRCLVMKPPRGLLELARRPEAIRMLHPELKAFCQLHAGFLTRRFSANKKIKCKLNIDLQRHVVTYMPTRDQLLALGRPDLVLRIKNAGGFLFVAHALGLKSTRRPNGFWHDVEKLDREIELFLWESWVKKRHKETGIVWFENCATNQVALEKTTPKIQVGSILVDSEGEKWMPQRKMVCAAGRWDLHHAIVWNGGYREVAHALGRKSVRSSRRASSGKNVVDMVSLLITTHTSHATTSIEKQSLKSLL